MTPPGAGKVEPVHEIQVPSAAGFCLENSLVRTAPGVTKYRGWAAKPRPSAKGNQGITPKVGSGFKSVLPALKKVTQALGSA